MIGLQANGASRHYLPDECERIDVAGIDYVSIAVGRLGRSIDFYTQNFGFFVVEDARGGQEPYVLMRAPGDFYLAIYERRDERAQAREATRRWSFLVNDLDRVRETVWNLGLATKDDCDEPTQLHRWRKDRSFLVYDPDGHEIELVERWSGRDIQVALLEFTDQFYGVPIPANCPKLAEWYARMRTRPSLAPPDYPPEMQRVARNLQAHTQIFADGHF